MVKYPEHVAKVFMGEPWPITYDGFKFEVKVVEMDEEHHIRCTSPRLNYRKAFGAIFRLLNEIAWFYGARTAFQYGSHSDQHVEVTYAVNTEAYLSSFRQRVMDNTRHLALGLLREAMFHDSPYYQFACLSRLLEIPFANGIEKGRWIASTTDSLSSDLSVSLRRHHLPRLTEQKLEDWLHSGRNRISHARDGGADAIDPNNYDHWEEIKWANVVLEELALVAVVELLGVEPNRAYKALKRPLP
jgi:hypothetical protein